MMNEPLREMISAVVDGEASEFEYRRVLDEVHDPEVRSRLVRHYTLRAVARSEAHALCPATLTTSILAAVAAEAPHPAAAPRRRFPVGGVAVAASVCMAAVFGLRTLTPAPDQGAVQSPLLAAAQGGALGQLGPAAAGPVRVTGPALPVGFGSVTPVAAAAQTGDNDPDRLAEQRLRLFMVDHVQNAALNTNQGMLPYARVVSYEAP